MINTNLLDVNFQNKFAFSTEQYFGGKMFEQNYTDYDNEPQQQIKNNENSNTTTANFDNLNKNPEIKDLQNADNFVETKTEEKNENNFSSDMVSSSNDKKDDAFKAPENINRTKDSDRPKRRSRFDQ